MKSAKELNEELDALMISAKAIVETAKSENRELTDEEETEFNKLSEEEIPAIRKALAAAQKREEQVARMAAASNRDRLASQYSDELGRASRSTLVLPTDGRQQEADPLPATATRLGKLKAFKDDRTAFNAGMWLRAVVARVYNRGEDAAALEHCRRIGWQVSNVGTEGQGATGGFVVPTPMAAAIIDVREMVGVLRQLCRVMPMTSDGMTVAKRKGGLTAYVGSESPAADMTGSDKSWGEVELTTKKRYVVHQLSQELVDDALIAIVDDAVSEMGQALARKEDDEIVNGDGSSTYGGIRGLLNRLGAGGRYTPANGGGKSVWTGLEVEDFTATMALLPEQYAIDPSWLCSRSFYYTTMLKVQAEAGGNTIASLAAGGSPVPMFMGYPVYFTDRMPTTTATSTVSALFGTYSQGVMIGERTGMRVSRSDEYAFLRDLVTLKATTRYDAQVHEGGNATDAGAYVGLRTAAS